MRKFSIILVVLMILGHLNTESWRLYYWLLDGETFYVNPFHDPKYSFPEEAGAPDGTINIFWWVKYQADDFLWCITFFVMAKIAKMYSWRLFLVSCVFFVYHLFDLIMLHWNFKQYDWLYLAVYVAAGLAIIASFIPEKKQATVKSLN